MWSARLCSARALTIEASPGRVASMGLKSRVRTCSRKQMHGLTNVKAHLR